MGQKGRYASFLTAHCRPLSACVGRMVVGTAAVQFTFLMLLHLPPARRCLGRATGFSQLVGRCDWHQVGRGSPRVVWWQQGHRLP